jgi:hypothetical protein
LPGISRHDRSLHEGRFAPPRQHSFANRAVGRRCRRTRSRAG